MTCIAGIEHDSSAQAGGRHVGSRCQPNPMPAKAPDNMIATLAAWRIRLRETHSLWPWSKYTADVTHGIAIVGEAGYVWKARTPAKLVAKVAKLAAREAVEHGEPSIQIEIKKP